MGDRTWIPPPARRARGPRLLRNPQSDLPGGRLRWRRGDLAASRSATGRPYITIPTDNPWVPLRILGLGKTGAERVEADVYLLTDSPAMLPQATGANGLTLTHSAAASDLLLNDLRSDKGMGWVPNDAWLSKIAIDAQLPTFGSIWRSTPRGGNAVAVQPESRATS